jgi:hypothetical protein
MRTVRFKSRLNDLALSDLVVEEEVTIEMGF